MTTYSLFGKTNLDRICGADLEPLQCISARRGLLRALKFDESDVRAARNQSHFLEAGELQKKSLNFVIISLHNAHACIVYVYERINSSLVLPD